MEHTSYIWVCFNCIQQDKSLIQCEYQFKLPHCCSISSNDRLLVVFPGFKMHYFVTKLPEWASAQITNRNPYIIDGLPNKTSFPQTRDSVHAWAGAGPNEPWRQQQWLWVLKGRQSGQQQQWLPGSCGRRTPWAPTRWPPSTVHRACPAPRCTHPREYGMQDS